MRQSPLLAMDQPPIPSRETANDVERGSYDGSARILVVDEDPGVRRLLSRALTSAGYRVQACDPNDHVLDGMSGPCFDLLMMDIDAPANGEIDLVRIARNLSPVPIVALSSHGDEATLVEALQAGADDYIQKPFRLGELLARTMNALRRRALEQGKPAIVVSDQLEIDLLRRRVSLRGQIVHLATRPYEVLRVLAENAGAVISHQHILETVWKSDRRSRIDYLRVAIRDLRLKLEADPENPRYIINERGTGYRLHVHAEQPWSAPAVPLSIRQAWAS